MTTTPASASGVFGLPPEYQSELDQAELRKQLAAAMLSRTATPVTGRMVGNHYVRANPLQHLAQILNQTFQRQGLEAAQRDISGVRSRAASDEIAERKSILEPLSSSTWTMPDPNHEVEGPVNFPVPADPQLAEQRGMAARFASNRALGDALYKRRMELFKAGSGAASGPSVLAGVRAGGDPSLLQGKTPPPVQVQKQGDTTIAFTQNPDDGKTTFKAVGPSTSIHVGEKFNNDMAKLGADNALKNLEKTQAEAVGAKQSLGSIQEALGALSQPNVETGITQPAQQVVRKLLSDFGIKDTGADAYDTLASRLKATIVQRAGGLGRQISDSDVKFLSEANGSTMLDSTALRRILAIGAAYDMMTLSRFNNTASSTNERFPELRGSPQDFNVPFQFRPGDPAVAKMIDSIFAGKSTFDAVPAAQQKNLGDVGDGVSVSTGGLSQAEEAERLRLRKHFGIDK